MFQMFESCLYDQIYSYFGKIFSKYQCGFRKGINTQHILLTMIEKMKISRGNKQFCAAILTDLSKAFDCIPYDLLIANLNAYGFDQEALTLIHSYLYDRSQKVKAGSSFSKELEIVFSVPQGSILGPLLFNIDICDLFFIDISSNIANYADDTTPYKCAPYYEKLKENLKFTIYKIFIWLKKNNFKANATKFHFFLSSHQSATINIDGSIIKSSNLQKLLGVTIDSNFTFEQHINSLCRKSSQKLHALSRIAQYLSQNKMRILFKTFVPSQFNYCPLVWMCHSRTLNNRINNIHLRALRIVYQDKQSSFEELLQKDNSVSAHMKNLQYLATKIFKIKNGLAPIIINEVFFNFQENESYNLRSGIHLASRNTYTAYFGTDTISSLGPKLWKQIPNKIKHAPTLTVFKAKIKSWTTNNCPCRLCKIFVKDLGFVEIFPSL